MKMDGYKAFILSKINYNWGWEDTRLNYLLAEASRQIGELNAYSSCLQNVEVYIKMCMKIEANKSSSIDGGTTTIRENLSEFVDVEPEKQEDWENVRNYVEALKYGSDKINEGSKVCTKLMTEMHKILMQGKSMQDKKPGKLRNSQNWIGGDTPSEAIYVPPPHEEIIECLTDFEKFIDNDNIDTPELVKLAMLHYQFESIHPFLGGNGKIGRMIIPLYLQSKGMLDKCVLYISDYFEKNKDTYFKMLTKVRTNSDIIGWIKFFLEAIIDSAKTAKEMLKKIKGLSEEMGQVALDLPVKPVSATKVLDTLFAEPIINKERLGEITEIKEGTMRNILNSLIEKEVVVKTKGYSKNIIIIFKKYTDLIAE